MPALIRIAGIAIVLVASALAPAAAHPLGNFTLNHLSRITVAPDGLRLQYVLDMAEIPAFALDRSLDPRGTPSDAALREWGRAHAAEIAPQLGLTVDGRAAAWRTLGTTVERRPAPAGCRRCTLPRSMPRVSRRARTGSSFTTRRQRDG